MREYMSNFKTVQLRRELVRKASQIAKSECRSTASVVNEALREKLEKLQSEKGEVSPSPLFSMTNAQTGKEYAKPRTNRT